MFVLTLTSLLVVFVVVTTKSGHKRAVETSESNLRNQFDKGLHSPETRKLMRDAGYNV